MDNINYNISQRREQIILMGRNGCRLKNNKSEGTNMTQFTVFHMDITMENTSPPQIFLVAVKKFTFDEYFSVLVRHWNLLWEII